MIGNSAVLAVLFVALYHGPLARRGLNLTDEGYLWFGIREVLKGKVPIRDFRAYDPGRYYFGAAWCWIFGSELLSLRIYYLVVQGIALWACIYGTVLVTGNLLSGGFMGAGITPWLFPRYKQADTAHLSMAVLLSLSLEILPHPLHFFAGLFVGYSFFLGLNHGLYCGAAFSLQIILRCFSTHIESPVSVGIAFLGGLLIGLVPVISMLLFVDGYAGEYWQQKVLRVVRRKSSNLTLPRPWIWRRKVSRQSRLNHMKDFLTRTLFTLMVPVYLSLILIALRSPGGNATGFLGVGCLGLFYFHHTQSRADFEHTALSLIPLLLGLGLLASGTNNPVLRLLLTAGFSSIFFLFGGFSTREWSDTPVEVFQFGRTSLKMVSQEGKLLETLQNICIRYSDEGDAVLVLPSLVTLYPLFQRRPAVYDMFCVYPATEEEESRMIEEIESGIVPFAIIDDSPQDKRNDLRFHVTHPAVWSYLQDVFVRVDTLSNLPADYHLFIRRTLGERPND